MSEAVLTAIISAGVTLLVCLINSHYQREEVNKKHNETVALIEYKIEELTKKVEKHNNVVERTFKLEELTALQEEKIKVANHRIDDLERRGE